MNKDLHHFWIKARNGACVLALLKGALRAVPVMVGALVLLASFHALLEVPLWGRRVLWLLAAVSTGAAVVSAFFPLKQFSMCGMARALSRRSAPGVLRPDEFHVAFQLASAAGSPGRSMELADIFVQETARKLKSCRPAWCFPPVRWAWLGGRAAWAIIAILLLGIFFPNYMTLDRRLLFPFGFSDLEGLVRIQPGDAEVTWGEDAMVELRMLSLDVGRPTLSVKTAEAWLPLQPESETASVLKFRVRNVVQPIGYRVGLQNEWSRKYTLTPRAPIRIDRFSVELTPPPYTQRAAVTQDSPEIAGLAGTSVSIEAHANTELSSAKVLFSDGREQSAKVDGELIKTGFILEASGDYVIEMMSRGGTVSKTAYPLRVQPDAPPSLSLLSPDQDLVVGEKEKLPLTFDARDDFGVAEIRLTTTRPGGETKTVTIRRFTPPTESTLATYEWDLASFGFRPGDVIRYQVEAVDGNVVTGPGRAPSPWRIVEIASFEQEHAALEQGLEAWREKALEVLARTTTMESKLAKPEEDPESMTGEFAKVNEGMRQLEEGLKRLVSKMEEDPLADYGVWLEHKAMQESLAALNRNTLPATQSALQTGNREAAQEGLERMSAEVERMAALSEDLSKTQNARDVMEAGERLEEIGKDLEAALSSGAPMSEIERQVRDLVTEAQKNMQEMARALQQMPQDLPEDFVNQQAIKELDLGKSQDILSQIQAALQKGDMQKALQLAQSFLAASQKMREQIGKAHESFLQSNSASDLAEKIQERQKELEKIVEDQRSVLAETQKLESKRLEIVMEKQKALLAALAKRQRVVLEKAGDWVNLPGFPPELNSIARGQMRPMGEVALEFENRKVDRSLEYLTVIVVHLQSLKTELARASVSLSNISEELRVEESAILKELSEFQDNASLGPEDSGILQSLRGRQQELGQRTDGLRQELQRLSRKTASLGVPLTEPLSEAAKSMGSAGDALGKGDSRGAQRNEESALSHLLKGQDALQDAQNAMQEMAQQQGGGQPGGSGTPQMIMRSGGGRQGTNAGKVRLPNAEDYRPPKAFREDLLESLKENYPKVYEEIIHKYYKRLAD